MLVRFVISVFLQNYDSGVKIFKAYHPDMFPFMGRKIGIIKDKNKRSKIIFNLFIVSFFSIYLHILFKKKLIIVNQIKK